MYFSARFFSFFLVFLFSFNFSFATRTLDDALRESQETIRAILARRSGIVKENLALFDSWDREKSTAVLSGHGSPDDLLAACIAKERANGFQTLGQMQGIYQENVVYIAKALEANPENKRKHARHIYLNYSAHVAFYRGIHDSCPPDRKQPLQSTFFKFDLLEEVLKPLTPFLDNSFTKNCALLVQMPGEVYATFNFPKAQLDQQRKNIAEVQSRVNLSTSRYRANTDVQSLVLESSELWQEMQQRSKRLDVTTLVFEKVFFSHQKKFQGALTRSFGDFCKNLDAQFQIMGEAEVQALNADIERFQSIEERTNAILAKLRPSGNSKKKR